MEFENKVVLVTGGAEGLGRAIVNRFVQEKAHVIVLDKNQELLEKLKTELKTVTTITVDLLDWAETRKCLLSLGPVHHLINNAGGGRTKDFLEVTEGDYDFVFGLNFKSIVNVSQCIAKQMIENKINGTIVNVASVLSKTTALKLSMYCASKAAVKSLTSCMAAELGPNIKVNCVCPTYMPTSLIGPLLNSVGMKNNINRQVEKRFLKPEEAAETILFLSSSRSAMIHGTSIDIDGGYLIR